MDAKDRKIRVAIVGRPNAGKSTLINRLLGEDRLLTGPEAGITRDAISVELQWRGRSFLLHDTAGLRKRARIDEKLEKLSVADAINAVKFADVVVLLMDAGADFEEQDLRIADLVEREGRALVIGMNKWDLKETGRHAVNKLREEADHWLPQVKGAGVVAVSGLTGEGLDRLMQARWSTPTTSGTSACRPRRSIAGSRKRHRPIRRRRFRGGGCGSITSRRRKRGHRASSFSARARTPCRKATSAISSTALREAFDLPGTPIRLTLREKDNPYAERK